VFKTPQTITLSGGQLELSDTTGTEAITGPAAGVTVNGGGASRVFQVDGLVKASISGLTITGGNSASSIFGGAGLYCNGGTATLTNCTISGNSVGSYYGGGGVSNNSGTLALTNCTVSGNAAGFGGGVLNYNGSLALTNCTVSGNAARYGVGGVSNYGTATLGNTIVAGNTGGDGGGVFTSQGNNLVGAINGTSGWVGSDLTGTNAKPLNPLLAPLDNYSGPIQTMALLPGELGALPNGVKFDTPPVRSAELPLMVQLVSVAVPSLNKPPSPLMWAELPLTVQLVSASVP
jgi:hypothetical protein